MRRRVALAAVVITAVALSACDPGDLGEFLDAIATEDLSQSSDRSVRAAGQTAVEVLSVREAEENLERGIAERDLAAVQQASRLRPDDPRYPMYEVALLVGSLDDTDTAQRIRAIDRSVSLVTKQNPTKPVQERIRITQEMFLDALLKVIKSAPEFEGRDQKVAVYCAGIQVDYIRWNKEGFPLEVAAYLFFADFELCES